MNHSRPSGVKLFIAIVLVALFGATIPAFSKFALEGFETFSLAWVRFFFALAVGLVWIRPSREILRQVWKLKWLGVVGAINPVFVFFSLEHIPANIVPFFFAATPMLSLIYNYVTTRNLPSLTQGFGFLLGLVGVAWITINTSTDQPTALGGIGLLAVAVSAFWVYNTWSNRILAVSETKPDTLAITLFIATVVIATPFAVPEVASVSDQIELSHIGAAAMVGVLGTAAFYFGLQQLLRVANAARAQLFTYLQAPFGAIIAFLLLGEQVTMSLAIGGTLALLGAALASRAS